MKNTPWYRYSFNAILTTCLTSVASRIVRFPSDFPSPLLITLVIRY